MSKLMGFNYSLTMIKKITFKTSLFLLSLMLLNDLQGQSCTGSFSLTVNITPLPEASFTFSVDENTVTFTNTSQNATDYIWDFGDNSLSSTEVNPVHTYTNPGDYVVSLLALNTCGNSLTTENVFLLCPPLEIPVEASGPVSFCEGGEVTLSTSADGFIYQWYDGADPINGADQNSVTVTESGYYRVAVVDLEGCINESAPVLVSVYFNPVFEFNPPNLVYCEGESLLLQGPTGFTAYQWYLDGEPITGGVESFIVVNETGNYSVEVWNPLSCSTLSNEVYISQATAPIVTIFPANQVVLNVGQDVILTAAAPGAIDFLWNNTSSGISINVSNAGLYTVTATDSNGCTGTGSAEVTLDPNSYPYIVEQVPNTLTVENDVTAVTYQWYLNGELIPGANSQDYQPDENGTYTCEVTYANGFVTFTPPYDFVLTGTENLTETGISLAVVPNPADAHFTLNIVSDFADDNALINLFDAAGKKMQIRKLNIPVGESQVEFDIRSFAAGIYRLQCVINQAVVNLNIVVH